ncbi:MAG TPA: hypothetical protein VLK82_19580 [Candidatus Tectomicrobia bacterium]|nr:hypothetical protein [Candidatus Tectomicrobia bacterium]
MDAPTHGRQPERVAILDKGHTVPEESVDVLPEPIAPLEPRIRLYDPP